MSARTLEERIRERLSARRARTGRAASDEWPTEEEWYRYLTAREDDPRLETLSVRIASDPELRTFAEELRRLAESAEAGEAGGAAPPDWVERAVHAGREKTGRCPACGRPKAAPAPPAARRWIDAAWLAASAAAFTASFAVPRYFQQCLALAVLCGIKWIVNRRQTRTQILIARSLEPDSGRDAGHLHHRSSRL